MNIECIADKAFHQAIAAKGTVPTFSEKYSVQVAAMIKEAVMTALSEVKRVSDSQELTISELRSQIEELNKVQKKASTLNPSFASVLQGKSAEKVQQRHQLINIVAAETENRQNRASNVIVIGLPKSNTIDDKTNIAEFFNACGLLNIEINHVTRINSSKKNETVSNHNIVTVSLLNEKDRANVLQRCNHHHVEKFKGIFAREDRTPAQQTKFNEQRAKLKKRNDELAAAGILDKPFRNVIHRRTGEICCINVESSNEQRKYVFASASTALSEYRKNYTTTV